MMLLRNRLVGLRMQLLLLAVVPMMAVAALAVVAAGWSIRDFQADSSATAVDRALDRVELDIGRTALRTHGYAQALAQRPDLVEAVAARNDAALRAILSPAFEGLRAVDPTISVMEATDASGRVLLRGHNPARAGDDKSRVDDVAAALAGRPGVGTEVSPTSGAMATGAVVPLRGGDGRVVGTLKVASTATDALVRDMAALSPMPRSWCSAPAAWRARPSRAWPPMRCRRMCWARSATEGHSRRFGSICRAGPHRAAMSPIRDLGGQPAGAVMVAVPLAPYLAAEMSMLAKILGLSGLAVVLAAPFALLAGRRLASPLRAIGVAMERISGGDTSAEVPALGRRDEIGAMSKALEVFRRQVQEKQRLEAQAQVEIARRERRQRSDGAPHQDFAETHRRRHDDAGAFGEPR